MTSEVMLVFIGFLTSCTRISTTCIYRLKKKKYYITLKIMYICLKNLHSKFKTLKMIWCKKRDNYCREVDKMASNAWSDSSAMKERYRFFFPFPKLSLLNDIWTYQFWEHPTPSGGYARHWPPRWLSILLEPQFLLLLSLSAAEPLPLLKLSSVERALLDALYLEL